ITAAALDRWVVFFDVMQPWEGSKGEPWGLSEQISTFVGMRTAVWLVAIGVAAFLAWRHVQQGHVDWRGAWRVAGGGLLVAGVQWLCGARHSFVLTDELRSMFEWLEAIVFCGAIAGV